MTDSMESVPPTPGEKRSLTLHLLTSANILNHSRCQMPPAAAGMTWDLGHTCSRPFHVTQLAPLQTGMCAQALISISDSNHKNCFPFTAQERGLRKGTLHSACKMLDCFWSQHDDNTDNEPASAATIRRSESRPN